jgi:hypothetical protein
VRELEAESPSLNASQFGGFLSPVAGEPISPAGNTDGDDGNLWGGEIDAVPCANLWAGGAGGLSPSASSDTTLEGGDSNLWDGAKDATLRAKRYVEGGEANLWGGAKHLIDEVRCTR